MIMLDHLAGANASVDLGHSFPGRPMGFGRILAGSTGFASSRFANLERHGGFK
jgi:hypothetical protein